MRKTLLFLWMLSLTFAFSTGCGGGPGVATEEESQESMDDTMEFDPMEATEPGAPGAAAEP